MVDYGFTDEGFVIKPQLVIETETNQQYQAIVGASANTRSQSVYGENRDIAADSHALLWENLQNANTQNTIAASGKNLDFVASRSGKRRIEAKASSIKDFQLTVSGNLNLAVGTTFSKTDETTIKYSLDTALAHTYAGPGDETVDVDLTCTTLGVVDVSDDSIIVIDNPTSNLVSVTNDSGSTFVQGVDEETDAELRARIQNDPFITVTGTDSGIRRRVLALNEIENSGYETILNCLVEANITLITDAAGRPGKSTEVIVYYGTTDTPTDQAIARAILNAAQEPTRFVSTTGSSYSETVTLDGGNTRDVEFSRPSEVDVYVRVDTTTEDGSLTGDQKTALKAAIAAWGNGLGLSEDVVVYGRDSLSNVLNIFQTVELSDYEISITTIGAAPGPTPGTTDANITIDTTEISTWDTANINIQDL